MIIKYFSGVISVCVFSVIKIQTFLVYPAIKQILKNTTKQKSQIQAFSPPTTTITDTRLDKFKSGSLKKNFRAGMNLISPSFIKSYFPFGFK